MDYEGFMKILNNLNYSKTKDYKKSLFSKPKENKEVKPIIDYIMPLFNEAIKAAENNPNNYGVLSEKVSSPKEADKILNKSVYNNFLRWIQAGRPNKFVDFMRDRWAPLGAENDPNNLNYNWSNNVRKLLNLSPQEREMWKKLNLVKYDFNNTTKRI